MTGEAATVRPPGAIVAGNPLIEPTGLKAARRRPRSDAADYDFLLAGPPGNAALSRDGLQAAGARAGQCGVSIRRVLIGEGHMAATDYVAALAASLSVPYHAAPARDGMRGGTDPHNLRQAWAEGHIDGQPTIVLDGSLISPRALRYLIGRLARRGLAVGLTTPAGMRDCVLASAGAALMREAISGLARFDPGASARAGTWLRQSLTLASLAGLVIGLIAIGDLSAQWMWTLLVTLPFLGVVGLRALALLLHQPPQTFEFRLHDRRADDRELPVYTLLVPLFREATVLPGLIDALRRLDYPAAKLDIKLILESVDGETIAAARQLNLRPPFEIIIVPDRQPRTKPKALNYALAFARGDYVCVFDAEDRPEPGQLREAWGMFAAAPGDLGCVQGRLAIDNERASWLTRQFSLEYLTLFDGLLPALEWLDAPMPLGGTSNHFPIRVLRQIGAWDAYNVTEDADLGMRLARHGFRCSVLSSRTFEEAPVSFGSWLCQRTRWLKGWMQTYVVHSRRPLRDFQSLGPRRWLAMHAHFIGVILSCLIYPFSLSLLVWQFGFAPPPSGEGSWIERLFLMAAEFNLLAGYGVTVLHSAVAAIGRRRWGLLWQLPLLPLYWLLISFAAYRALIQLGRTPFHWEKTTHGQSARDGAAPAAGRKTRRKAVRQPVA